MQRDESFWILLIHRTLDGWIEVLLINQKSGEWNYRWFCKWHKEAWESWLDAAKRDLWEEVWINDIKLLWEKTFTMNYQFELNWIRIEKSVTYRVASTNQTDCKIQAEELNGYKWANFKNAQAILSHENNKNLLNKLMSYLWELSDNNK